MERGRLTGWPEEAPTDAASSSLEKPDVSAWPEEPSEAAEAPAAPSSPTAAWVPVGESLDSTPTLKLSPSRPTRQVPVTSSGVIRAPKPAAFIKPVSDSKPRERQEKKSVPARSLAERYHDFEIQMARANDHDVAVSLQQMAVMLKAGINPGRTFTVLAEQSTNRAIRHAFEDIAAQVLDKGWSFSDALSRHPRVFPAEVLLLARAGEESGDLADRLMRASEMLERKYNLLCKVKQALTSPLITCVACVGVLFGITKFVLPRFLGLYDQMDAKLPAISKVVIGVVNVINSPLFLLLIVGLIALVVAKRAWLQQRAFEMAVNNPVTRYLVGSLLAAQFVDVLETMQRDGIPLQRGLQLMRSTSPFRTYSNQLSVMCERLEQEGSLAEAVQVVPYFPRMISSMLIVGEETGELQDLLSASRRMLEEQNEVVLTQIVTVVEPAVIGMMGVAMGFLCVGMFLPIYGLLEKLAA